MTVQSTDTFIPCRHCGFQWERYASVEGTDYTLVDGRIIRCTMCPATPAMDGGASCRGCGQSVRLEFGNPHAFRCLDCVADRQRYKYCEGTYHKGRRTMSAPMVSAYVSYTKVTKQARTTYLCITCARSLKAVPWQDYQASLFRDSAVPRPDHDTRLSPSDPYHRLGGRANMWRPRKGPAGVGSYLLFRYERFQSVLAWCSGKGMRTFTARDGTLYKPENKRVFTFAEELKYCPYPCWAFIAITGCDPNTLQHKRLVATSDSRDALMEDLCDNGSLDSILRADDMVLT